MLKKKLLIETRIHYKQLEVLVKSVLVNMITKNFLPTTVLYHLHTPMLR